MTVYHGSNQPIPLPDVLHSRKNVDFGVGFYVTPLEEQAKNWCRKFQKLGDSAFVSSYELDDAALSGFHVLRFDAYDGPWLEFILRCRKGQDTTDYDIVMGGVANDRVFDTIELLTGGLIDENEALSRLKYVKPNYQICLRHQEVIDQALRYLGSEQL